MSLKPAPTSKEFRIALIQLAVTESKGRNLLRAVSKIKEAALKGADIVALPECFNSPYGTRYFPEYAEKIPGDSSQALSRAASDNKVFIIGGSIPEEDNGKLYNTCPVFNEAGEMVEKHRKVHLFDINIPEKIQFLESDTLSPGSNLTSFNTSFCKVGIGICYDIRFAEMAQLYARQGCKLLVYPGAFNMVTGPTHWELLQRARAVDNQVYVAAVSPARDVAASYVAWGHSSVVSPWGEVMASAEHEETIVYADLDLNYLSQVRDQVPIIKQRRNELYEVRALSPSS